MPTGYAFAFFLSVFPALHIAKKLSSALGKPISYIDLPPDQMLANMQTSGMPSAFAETMVQFSTGAGAQIHSGVSEILNRPARSIDHFLADNLDAFR